MNVLICGADGFIGRHLCTRFVAAGHQVRRGVRRPRLPGDIAIDYAHDHDPAVWLPRLEGIDVVINAIGILTETPEQTFAAIHTAAPQALFDACAGKPGIRVIQISALGAELGSTAYFRSKRAADQHLSQLDLEWTVLRVSLVYGSDGASSRMFRTLATLPLAGLPGGGNMAMQPVHIDDLCDCVLNLSERRADTRRIYDIAGPETVTYRELLTRYRQSLGLSRGYFLPIPIAVMRITAYLAEALPQRVLSRDTLSMLLDGSSTPNSDTPHLLQRAPRGINDFILPEQQATLRYEAVNTWALPLLQLALACMWISAAVCALLDRSAAFELLSRIGASGASAHTALYAAVSLNLLLGLCTLWRPSPNLWLAQIALTLAYTAIITLKLPEFWLDPFGPIVKNLPLLAILLMLHAITPPPQDS